MSKPKEYLISGDNYFPNTVAEKSNSLPAGAYQIALTPEGAPYFMPMKITTDKIVDIPDSPSSQIINEVEKFWSEGVSEKFKTYGLVQKRGIIFAGEPGTGKTIALAQSARVVIEKFHGVVLFNPQPDYLPLFLRLLKEIEPDKKVMVMWEEFDSILNRNESELLSLLDGETQVDNIIYLATTNYLARIPARIKNRPSRFAKIIEVGKPSREAREAFLISKLTEADKEKHLATMLDASENFVIDQLKDLIISVCVFEYPISEAVLKIKEMQEGSVGMDDYQEKQARDVFKNMTSQQWRGPLGVR